MGKRKILRQRGQRPLDKFKRAKIYRNRLRHIRDLAPRTVQERVERQRRRIGAALGIVKWNGVFWSSRSFHGDCLDSTSVQFALDGFFHIRVLILSKPPANCRCRFSFTEGKWSILHDNFKGNDAHLNKMMARTLYLLDIEDEQVTRDLNASLSAHEQLELRLNFPRKFWPKSWRCHGSTTST